MKELPSGYQPETYQVEKPRRMQDYLAEPNGPVLFFRWSINNRKSGQRFVDQLAKFDRFGEKAEEVKHYTLNRDAEPVYASEFLAQLDNPVAQVFGRIVDSYGFPAVVLPFIDEHGEKPSIPYQYRSVLPSDIKQPLLEINTNTEAVLLLLDVNDAKEKCVHLVRGPLGAIMSFQPGRSNDSFKRLATASISKKDTQEHSLLSLVADLQDQARMNGSEVTIDAEHIKTALMTILVLPKAQDGRIVQLTDLMARDELLMLSQEFPEFVIPFLQAVAKTSDVSGVPNTWSDVIASFGRGMNSQTKDIADAAREKVESQSKAFAARIGRVADNDAHLLEAQVQVDAIEEEKFRKESEAVLAARYTIAESAVATAEGVLHGILEARNGNIEGIYFDNFDQAKLLMEHAMDQVQGQVRGEMKQLVASMKHYIDQGNPNLPLPVNDRQAQLLQGMIPTLQLPATTPPTEE